MKRDFPLTIPAQEWKTYRNINTWVFMFDTISGYNCHLDRSSRRSTSVPSCSRPHSSLTSRWIPTRFLTHTRTWALDETITSWSWDLASIIRYFAEAFSTYCTTATGTQTPWRAYFKTNPRPSTFSSHEPTLCAHLATVAPSRTRWSALQLRTTCSLLTMCSFPSLSVL